VRPYVKDNKSKKSRGMAERQSTSLASKALGSNPCVAKKRKMHP
jgi:hypothetical protein